MRWQQLKCNGNSDVGRDVELTAPPSPGKTTTKRNCSRQPWLQLLLVLLFIIWFCSCCYYNYDDWKQKIRALFRLTLILLAKRMTLSLDKLVCEAGFGCGFLFLRTFFYVFSIFMMCFSPFLFSGCSLSQMRSFCGGKGKYGFYFEVNKGEHNLFSERIATESGCTVSFELKVTLCG